MSTKTRKRVYAGAGCLTLAICLLVARAAPAQEELDSLKVCADTQKLILENAFVRVIDDRIPAGVAERKHRHLHGLTIVLGDYISEQTVYPERRIVRTVRKAGDVNWAEPTVHEVRNVGTTDSHVIRIELK